MRETVQEISKFEKGPLVYHGAGEGASYWMSSPAAGYFTVKISPENSPYTTFSVFETVLLPGGRSDDGAFKWSDRHLMCFDGEGRVRLGVETRALAIGTSFYCGRNVPLEIENTGDCNLRLLATAFGPGPERMAALGTPRKPGEAAPPVGRASLGDDVKAGFGFIGRAEADALPASMRGVARYCAPEDGESYWQADPTAGYITVKLCPTNFEMNHFAVATQLLEPAAYVREHTHRQCDEMIFVFDGEGYADINGERYDFGKGTLAVFGRYNTHRIVNTGKTGMMLMGVMMPPGIEAALSETGVRRKPGDPRPNNIPRNAETGKILAERYGMIVTQGQG